MLVRRITTFGLVGATSTLAYMALALSFGQAGVGPVRASFAAYLVGMAISYTGHRRLTFGSSRPHFEALPRFLLLNLFGLGLSLAAPWALTERAGLPAIVAVVTAGILVPLASFIGHALFVFPDRNDRGPTAPHKLS